MARRQLQRLPRDRAEQCFFFELRNIQKRRRTMNRKSTVLFGLVCLVALFLAMNTRAGNNGAVAFEKMKSLAGHWEGSAPGDAKLTADIEVTSDGNAVLERFQMIEGGKPMNMVTINYLDGDTLKMTPYWHPGNQPTLAPTYDPAAGVVTFALVTA